MTKIKTLFLTGANNHDWRRSTPACKEILEKSGRFDVDVTETPGVTLADVAAIQKYQLFFSDYNGPDWGEPAKTNFEAAVWNGMGLVILHAADNAFPGWPQYEKMVGLLWRKGTGHGAFHEFEVTIADHEHPITQGLSNFKQWDELYHNLVHMHGVRCKVLATAYSAPETKGTGKHEPMMVVTQYGKGRVYHHVLGHVWPGDPTKGKGMTLISFENPPFQKALVRGCEWAAKGTVTLS